MTHILEHIIYSIDAWIPNAQKKTGVQMYAFQLIQAMKKQALQNGERVMLFSPDALDETLSELPAGWESRLLSWPPRRGWMSLRVGWELFRRPPAVFFVPSQGLPRFFYGKSLTMIHDIAFIVHPELYEPKQHRMLHRVTRHAVRRATKILVPTQATKQDVLDFFHVQENRIIVTPEASDSKLFHPYPLQTQEALLQKYRLGKNFFLTVGRLEKKKNLTTLIRAFELFKERRGLGDPFELVLIGNPGFEYEEIKKYIVLSKYKNQIRELGYVSDEEVAILMSACGAYLFPSWYEGFGIPNLDAMATGTPLITSDIPAHREVVADAGMFVPPGNPEAWAHALENIVRNADLREELIQKGFKRATEFSWDKTAAQTWAVLRSLV